MCPEQRFAVVERLARAQLIHWAVIGPCRAVFASFSDIADDTAGFLYHHPEADLRHGSALVQAFGFHRSYAVYEPGFARIPTAAPG